MSSNIHTIVQIDENPSNVLRKKALPIINGEFNSPELLELISNMRATLANEEDGVALAAPQIGVSKQIFVVSPLAYKKEAVFTPLVFINPKIIKKSGKKIERQEGCLSVRWVYGKTKRYLSITIEAFDEKGKLFTYGASGLIAHIFQHEIDHLNAILFIDHGYDLEEYTEAEMKEAMKK
jgi:peptide deformylase